MGFADVPSPAYEAGPPNLADVSTRERLTPAAVEGVVRLATIWRLTSAEVCAVLGDVSERTWFRMKKSAWSGALSHDTLTVNRRYSLTPDIPVRSTD